MNQRDIQKSETYLFDPKNTMSQTEIGFTMAKALQTPTSNIISLIFRNKVPVNLFADNKIKALSGFTDKVYEINPEVLEPMNGENVIIRYPEDVPVFSNNDIMILTKMAKIVTSDKSVGDKFSVEEIVKLMALVEKVRFYGQMRNGDTDV